MCYQHCGLLLLCVQYAAIFDLESWLYLDGLHGIETVAVIFGSTF